ELGRSASVVPLGRLDPLALAAEKTELPTQLGESLTIPPPPMREAALRSARIIDSHAFTVRPEIVKALASREPAAASREPVAASREPVAAHAEPGLRMAEERKGPS